ncbi:hypothetical protein ACS0TY_030662 [Phlomoides rotata]
MHSLEQLRRRGGKKDVELDEREQPVGQEGTKMQSYIGVVTRQKVKITYNTWKEVPRSIKDSIWDSVNELFNISKSWKKTCLVSANQKWRSHKARLTKLYVFGKENSPDLYTPPTDYHHIKKEDWSKFVDIRMSDEFKEKSNKHKGIRARHKYPHRLSRKGYARYANEIRSLLSGDPEVDRTVLWLEGRKTKKGEYEGEELKETVSKIVQYIEKKKAGTVFYGVRDGILAKALESDEHVGRVRGVGGHVTPSSYFDRSKRKGSTSQILERLEKLEKEVYRPYTPSSKNENENFESPVEKCSYQVDQEDKGKNVEIENLVEDVVLIEKSDETLNVFDVNLQGKPVALHLKPLDDIVAYGTIIKAYGPTEKIHSKILPENCVRVSIDTEVIPKAKLPIRTNEFMCVGEAVGSHVAWPVGLMTLHKKQNILCIYNKKGTYLGYGSLQLCEVFSLHMSSAVAKSQL